LGQPFRSCGGLSNGTKFFRNGSAADARYCRGSVNRFLIERPPLPAIALTTDTSILTSISNDFGFVDSFSKQIKALGREGDVAICFSTSGKSPNVIKAVKVAKEMGLKTVSLTGGWRRWQWSDFALGGLSSTPRIQVRTIGHVREMVDRLFQQPAWIANPSAPASLGGRVRGSET
jgi:D-sedoheptulose 7-phosphate isomerase